MKASEKEVVDTAKEEILSAQEQYDKYWQEQLENPDLKKVGLVDEKQLKEWQDKAGNENGILRLILLDESKPEEPALSVSYWRHLTSAREMAVILAKEGDKISQYGECAAKAFLGGDERVVQDNAQNAKLVFAASQLIPGMLVEEQYGHLKKL